jgi:hypothetical protein
MQITRIKPGGWVIIILLLAGIVFGVRSWRSLLTARQGGAAPIAGAGAVLTTDQAAGGDILISTSGTKQKWMQAEIDKFNAQSTSGKASLQLAESRDAMQGILAGKFQPTIWSPSSPVWVYRLADLWPKDHGGAQIANVNDSQSYRQLFKSPLVFLTTRSKAAFLRPILSGSSPWAGVRQLSTGQRKAPWGKFRFAYADPLNASSGTLTMSLIISEYGRLHGSTDLAAAAGTPEFAVYLSQINRAYVRDPSATGSSSLEKAYTANISSRDFITAYESAALAAVERDPNFVMIYPSPTAVSDQTATLLSAAWISPAQKTTALAFLDFIGKPEALDDGVQYFFRPSQNGAATLSARLGPNSRAQFQPQYTTIDLPPYDALNEAAAQWHSDMK